MLSGLTVLTRKARAISVRTEVLYRLLAFIDGVGASLRRRESASERRRRTCRSFILHFVRAFGCRKNPKCRPGCKTRFCCPALRAKLQRKNEQHHRKTKKISQQHGFLFLSHENLPFSSFSARLRAAPRIRSLTPARSALFGANRFLLHLFLDLFFHQLFYLVDFLRQCFRISLHSGLPGVGHSIRNALA